MDLALSLPVLIGLIVTALAFDFLNGLHDAANSIATIVSTRVLRPRYAVAWAAFFNFIAFLFFGLHVAQTVGTGIVDAPINACELLEGMPAHQVIKFHEIAPISAPKITRASTICASTMPVPTICATCRPKNRNAK